MDFISINSEAIMIIESTVPVEYIMKVRARFETGDILSLLKFLCEGKALYDNLYPSRIICILQVNSVSYRS